MGHPHRAAAVLKILFAALVSPDLRFPYSSRGFSMTGKSRDSGGACMAFFGTRYGMVRYGITGLGSCGGIGVGYRVTPGVGRRVSDHRVGWGRGECHDDPGGHRRQGKCGQSLTTLGCWEPPQRDLQTAVASDDCRAVIWVLNDFGFLVTLGS